MVLHNLYLISNTTLLRKSGSRHWNSNWSLSCFGYSLHCAHPTTMPQKDRNFFIHNWIWLNSKKMNRKKSVLLKSAYLKIRMMGYLKQYFLLVIALSHKLNIWWWILLIDFSYIFHSYLGYVCSMRAIIHFYSLIFFLTSRVCAQTIWLVLLTYIEYYTWHDINYKRGDYTTPQTFEQSVSPIQVEITMTISGLQNITRL